MGVLLNSAAANPRVRAGHDGAHGAPYLSHSCQELLSSKRRIPWGESVWALPRTASWGLCFAVFEIAGYHQLEFEKWGENLQGADLDSAMRLCQQFKIVL